MSFEDFLMIHVFDEKQICKKCGGKYEDVGLKPCKECKFKEKCWVAKEGRCNLKPSEFENCYEYMGFSFYESY